MSNSTKLEADILRSLPYTSISAAYAGIGNALSNPARILIIQNLTNAEVMFSFDGIHDNLPMPSNAQLILDITANKTIEDGFFLGAEERLYVKESGTPTSGNVYLTVFYGSKD